ncbi:hypothetical protein J2S42_006641 [Catenuloplanes indicus]|uniref:Uncharacterized protein n=1 Tax=Catenuloplanes indicus TaxID=137267 RepID=A0AAE3W640_9ACTN|nr:hypothetical protein [Catenuloplanes indicus]
MAVRRRELKRFVDPVRGLLSYDCRDLLSEDGRVRLNWFTPIP